MIQVLDLNCSAAERPLLKSMFADRKRLFVDFFGWDVPIVDGQYEMDQFDDDHSVYIIASSSGAEHEASIRLYPTMQPHMLDMLFPHLCPFGVPVGESIWESTRLCLPRRHGAEGRRELRNRLFSAMVDVALDRGIKSFTGVIPEAFRKEVLSLGWRAEPLGPAVRIPGGPIGAFLIHIDGETCARLRWTGVYVGADDQRLV